MKFVMDKQGPMHFVSLALVLSIAFLFEILLVQAQDKSGFISIDCGLPENSSYVDQSSGITYVSDETFIDTGVSKEIPDSNLYYSQQYRYLRSFPKGIRNCYTINVKKGQKYLIRAFFFYGNYDNKNEFPEFDLYLGVGFWANIVDASLYEEIIHVVSTSHLRLCLVNKGNGAPFVTSIEVRPLPSDMYNDYFGDQSLLTLQRADLGIPGLTFGYNRDTYDRIWEGADYNDYGTSTITITTSMLINQTELFTDYPPPSTVMATAVIPLDLEEPLHYIYPNSYTNNSIHPVTFKIYLYFAELQKLAPNQSRVFTINSSYTHYSIRGGYTPTYLSTDMVTFSETYPVVKELQEHRLYLIRDKESTLPPLINAVEFFEEITIFDSQTQEEEVDAMMNIKSVHNVTTRNWQGDPCAPEAFIWDGIKCADDASNTSNIISLNLSSAELTGNISSYISHLTELRVLDLSYNYLTGPVPDFLADMKFLKVINLSGNNLTGSIPTKLLEKSKHRSLTLSLDGNPYLCQKQVCNVAINTIEKNHRRNNHILAIKVGIAAGSLLIIFSATMAIFWHFRLCRNRRLGPLETNNNLRIRYWDIATVTDNFKTIIGEGGFGKVYLGKLGGKEVAVKMLSPSSFQGHKEFQAEAELLMRVHHTNLISLIGYCDEDNNLGLVYEYMALGNLRMHLSERNENTLSWEQRLQIATDAAQGLGYLHRGCKPVMIHRDVKSSNILINEQFNGKVADFGLSRASPLVGGHPTTAVAGTPGYLDPEYFATNKLNEKSDVYSFGIVLMEIVTSRSVIGTSLEDHIIQYVNKMITTGDISGIIDPRLKGDADVNSVWRVLELATTCVAHESTRRPNMYQVAMELEECLASIRNLGGDQKAPASKMSMESGPEAR